MNFREPAGVSRRNISITLLNRYVWPLAVAVSCFFMTNIAYFGLTVLGITPLRGHAAPIPGSPPQGRVKDKDRQPTTPPDVAGAKEKLAPQDTPSVAAESRKTQSPVKPLALVLQPEGNNLKIFFTGPKASAVNQVDATGNLSGKVAKLNVTKGKDAKTKKEFFEVHAVDPKKTRDLRLNVTAGDHRETFVVPDFE